MLYCKQLSLQVTKKCNLKLLEINCNHSNRTNFLLCKDHQEDILTIALNSSIYLQKSIVRVYRSLS